MYGFHLEIFFWKKLYTCLGPDLFKNYFKPFYFLLKNVLKLGYSEKRTYLFKQRVQPSKSLSSNGFVFNTL